MTILRLAAATLSFALLSGCFIINTGPKGKSFDPVVDLKSLEGCYDNIGTGAAEKDTRQLVYLIFSPEEIGKNKFDFIRVVAEGDNALRVSAESKSGTILQKTFVAGRDFQFDSGRIRIPFAASHPTGPGGAFLGFVYGSYLLGLDQNSDGRSEEVALAAGTLFLVFPLSAYGKEAYSYKRRPDLCQPQ